MDRFGELNAFIAVVEAGGFSVAARKGGRYWFHGRYRPSHCRRFGACRRLATRRVAQIG